MRLIEDNKQGEAPPLCSTLGNCSVRSLHFPFARLPNTFCCSQLVAAYTYTHTHTQVGLMQPLCVAHNAKHFNFRAAAAKRLDLASNSLSFKGFIRVTSVCVSLNNFAKNRIGNLDNLHNVRKPKTKQNKNHPCILYIGMFSGKFPFGLFPVPRFWLIPRLSSCFHLCVRRCPGYKL